jgi:hypothetical protein
MMGTHHADADDGDADRRLGDRQGRSPFRRHEPRVDAAASAADRTGALIGASNGRSTARGPRSCSPNTAHMRPRYV